MLTKYDIFMTTMLCFYAYLVKTKDMQNETIVNYLMIATCFALLFFIIIGSKIADHSIAMQMVLDAAK